MLDHVEKSYNLTVQEDVVLAHRAHDAARVTALLKRVAEEADRLELIHLPDADRPLEVFAEDLRQEGAGLLWPNGIGSASAPVISQPTMAD